MAAERDRRKAPGNRIRRTARLVRPTTTKVMTMIRIERSISSAADPVDVWTYLSEFSNTAEWDPGTPTATRVDDGPVGVGTRYDLVARFRGTDSEIVYVVTKYEPPRLIQLVGENRTVHSTDMITVSPTTSGCTVEYVAEFRLRGLAVLAQPFLRKPFERLGTDAMAGMQVAIDRLAQRLPG